MNECYHAITPFPTLWLPRTVGLDQSLICKESFTSATTHWVQTKGGPLMRSEIDRVLNPLIWDLLIHRTGPMKFVLSIPAYCEDSPRRFT